MKSFELATIYFLISTTLNFPVNVKSPIGIWLLALPKTYDALKQPDCLIVKSQVEIIEDSILETF